MTLMNLVRIVFGVAPIEFRVMDAQRDRRTPAQLASLSRARQEAADLALERAWRERVAGNVARRERAAAIARAQPARLRLLERQAS